jgi:hypothetical protein
MTLASPFRITHLVTESLVKAFEVANKKIIGFDEFNTPD